MIGGDRKPVTHDLIAMWSRLIKNSQNLLKIYGSLMAKFWMSMLKSTTKIELHPRNEKLALIIDGSSYLHLVKTFTIFILSPKSNHSLTFF